MVYLELLLLIFRELVFFFVIQLKLRIKKEERKKRSGWRGEAKALLCAKYLAFFIVTRLVTRLFFFQVHKIYHIANDEHKSK
jgi:hypothetical protein